MDFFVEKAHGSQTLLCNRYTCERTQDFATIDFEPIFGQLPSDAVIACGGDGTLIEAYTRYHNRPILGINFGTRGFLMIAPQKVLSATSFYAIERNTLDISIGGEHFSAINELSLKSTTGHMLSVVIDIYPSNIDGCSREGERADSKALFSVKTEKHIGSSLGSHSIEMKADGCLICTASGSTGYNHSLGGPLLLDDVNFCLTPIAPMSPRAMSSLVYSVTRNLSLSFSHARNTDIVLHADSREIFAGNTSSLDTITLTSGKEKLTLLVPDGMDLKSSLDIFSYT